MWVINEPQFAASSYTVDALKMNRANPLSVPSSPVKMASGSTTPHATPTKRDHGDRYIPMRQPSGQLHTRFTAIPTQPQADGGFVTPTKRSNGSGSHGGRSAHSSPYSHHHSSSHHHHYSSSSTHASPNNQGDDSSGVEDASTNTVVMKALLRNELLYDRIDDVRYQVTAFRPVQDDECDERDCTDSPSAPCHNPGGPVTPGGSLPAGGPIVRESPSAARALFQYGHTTRTPNKYGAPSTSSPMMFNGPLSEDSQRLLKSPRKPQRKVPKNPYKVLDAPELQDDFYLNLVDWSSQNMLSVGLNTCVYLWSACNSQVIKLCDLATDNDTVTSVQWADKGEYLAVGTNRGITQIWDVHAQKKVQDLTGHSSRVGCLAWNGDLICSGSRDRHIVQRDIRVGSMSERRLSAHRQEVCGLKWSPDKQYLASGGNDNQLLVWSMRRSDPCQVYTEHNAAVKALAWSPHHHGLLVSGGGTADRCLRFWNTLTGQPMQCIDTGSQVCNVAWSKHSPELVSTHGYSFNQVVIWKYPSLQPVIKLTGHQYRVLYLAMSPDGESIVTGAGDETLRFWHVFSKTSTARSQRSKLNLFTSLR